MAHTWIALILGFLVSIALPGGCRESGTAVSIGPDHSDLKERFRRIEIGMGAARLEEILGTPDRVIPYASEPANRILVWRERWFALPRATAVAKLEEDRTVIASYSSGRIPDPEAWIREIESRQPVNRIPGALLSEEDRWASLSAIVAKLRAAWKSKLDLDAGTIALFDAIEPGSSADSIAEHAGDPESIGGGPDAAIHIWNLGAVRLTVTFRDRMLASKQIENGPLEIVVRDGFWRASDRQRRVSTTEHL